MLTPLARLEHIRRPARLVPAIPDRPSLRFLALAVWLSFACGSSLAQDEYLLELESGLDGMTGIEDPAAAVASPTSPQTPATSARQEEFFDEIGSEIDGLGDSPGNADGAVPEDPRAQFDSDLRDRMPGTFVLYKRLSDDDQGEVFEEYQVSGDYLRVRRKIIELRRRR